MATEQLSDVLREFARTMLTDFPIQRILDHLVTRIVDIMPVTAAGVTVISADAGPRLRRRLRPTRAAVREAPIRAERRAVSRLISLGSGDRDPRSDQGRPLPVVHTAGDRGRAGGRVHVSAQP